VVKSVLVRRTALRRMGAAVLVGLALLSCGAGAAIPERADALPAFLPESARIESRVDADFDGNGAIDVAAVVRGEGERYLLVAVAEGKGLRRVGLGELDPEPLIDASLSAAKNVLAVEELVGGTTAISSTYRYRYEVATGRMRLMGDDVTLYSRTNAHGSTRISTDRLTGKRIIVISEPAKEGYRDGQPKRSRVAIEKIYMESAPSPWKTVGMGD